MNHTDDNAKTEAMTRRLSMAFLVGSIAEDYLSEAVDLMKELGVYRHEVKRRIGMAEEQFDYFNHNLKWIFGGAGEPLAGQQLLDDYEIIKQALDRFMNTPNKE